MKFTILGCGSSPGVPRIGGDWGACDANNPRNRRKRCSLLVEKYGKNGVTRIIVDTTPDFRQQCLDHDVDWADAILYTHSHADHVHGIDDLRGFVINRRRKVEIYGDEATLARLHQGFGYCFETPKGSSYPPILNANEITVGDNFDIDGPGGTIQVRPFAQIHGDIISLGFRFDRLAYSPDVSQLTDAAISELQNLDVWIVDALRYTPHPSHFSVTEAREAISIVKPKAAVLTHMHIDLDFQTLCDELPENIRPAFDGWSWQYN